MQILNYEMSSHPGPQNTFLSGFQNLTFMSAIAETSSLAKLFKNIYACFGGSVLRGLTLELYKQLLIVSVIITL